MTNLADIGKKIKDTTQALAKADSELKWELAASAADVAGMVDPTPASDLIGAGLAVRKGDWLGAGMSLVSVVPYLGDAVAKPAKAVRAAKRINELRQTVTKLTAKLADLRKQEKQLAAANGKIPKNGNGNHAPQKAASEQADAIQKKEHDCTDCKPAASKPAPLRPGTAEHKASRWERYQERGGEKTYEQWSKQYDVNMRNFSHGIEREKFYREMMNASEGTVKTPFTNRQIDILKNSEKYAGQLKTGPVSLTKENILAIKKDASLVRRGWKVEHILEKGASSPYIEALKKAGIDYVTKPKF